MYKHFLFAALCVCSYIKTIWALSLGYKFVVNKVLAENTSVKIEMWHLDLNKERNYITNKNNVILLFQNNDIYTFTSFFFVFVSRTKIKTNDINS